MSKGKLFPGAGRSADRGGPRGPGRRPRVGHPDRVQVHHADGEDHPEARALHAGAGPRRPGAHRGQPGGLCPIAGGEPDDGPIVGAGLTPALADCTPLPRRDRHVAGPLPGPHPHRCRRRDPAGRTSQASAIDLIGRVNGGVASVRPRHRGPTGSVPIGPRSGAQSVPAPIRHDPPRKAESDEQVPRGTEAGSRPPDNEREVETGYRNGTPAGPVRPQPPPHHPARHRRTGDRAARRSEPAGSPARSIASEPRPSGRASPGTIPLWSPTITAKVDRCSLLERRTVEWPSRCQPQLSATRPMRRPGPIIPGPRSSLNSNSDCLHASQLAIPPGP